MAQEYRLWKDDLDFAAEREMYWGTAAPRLADQRLESHQPVEDGEEQEENRPSCAPCLDQGRECSKEMPICAQCRSEEAPAMCSYHVNRASVPDSKHQGATKKMRWSLDANLAVALEYLNGAVDDIEDKDLPNDNPSNEGPWKRMRAGDITVPLRSPTGDQEQKRSEVVAEAGLKDESDGETATPVITKYKEQIANTFRPWVAQKDEKVIPSACDFPDTSLLQALHYYSSYYYTHVSPSPDMFEAMDLTSHIALGMIVQEVISDFAFKLGKDSQLEDIQVKIDKLVAAQHSDRWDSDFLDYLESRTADRSLPLTQPAKKLRHSGSMDRSAESADERGLDLDIGEDDMSHDSQTWDELEEMRRTTTSLSVNTVKELVNRTRFDISAEEVLEVRLEGIETGRLSTSSLHMDSDLDSSNDSDAGSTSAGNGGWLTQSTLASSKETPFKVALGSDSETSFSGEEDTEMPVRNSTRSTTRGSEVGSLDRDDYDMTEIDFSPTILTHLSNNLFGSQPALGLDDSSSDDDSSDELDGPTLVRSQVLPEDSDESSEVEDGSSESDSEQEEKATSQGKDKEAKDNSTVEKDDKVEEEDKKEESEKDVDSDKGEHLQEDYEDTYGAFQDDDISPSVLTQVSATRFGSTFELNEDESSSEEDDVFNPSGGRFVVQSQVVQDDSDDESSEAQEDSSDTDSEQEEQDEEGREKDSIAAKDTGDNKPTKEDYVAAETKEDNAPVKKDLAEDDDEVEEEVGSEIASSYEESDAESIEPSKRLSGRAIEESDVEIETAEGITKVKTVDETRARGQSRSGSEADVDMPSEEEHKTREVLARKDDRVDEMEEEDKGEPSQPVYTTVNATRFGSQFSTSYNPDDDDESEEEGTAYGGTQSQVVYDDSTTSEEENVQSSTESDSD
ncbi:hypothetical protein BGZ91_002120 [Linnemannia elongata]|nr:hypothetical protein BGZ91_002120 [Linnemannia elongata]